MHFWVSATRGGFHVGFCCPRKIGTNWFIPALVKSKFGASGSSDEDGTMVCFFSRKKSRNDWRISVEVIVFSPRMNTNKHQFDKAENPARLTLDFFRAASAGDRPDRLLVVLQDFFCGIATLGKLRAFVVQPRAALFDDLFLQSDIEQCAGRGDSLVVHDVELGLRKRRRDLVLHDLYAGAIPCDDAIRLFDRADAPNIDAHAGVKL